MAIVAGVDFGTCRSFRMLTRSAAYKK